MINSAVKSRLPQRKLEDQAKTVASEATKNVGRPTTPGDAPLRNSSPLPTKRSSSTSMVSRQAAPDAAAGSQKLKNKFTQPRMNRLADQRITRARCTANGGEVDYVGQDKALSLKRFARSRSQQSLVSYPPTCDMQLESLHKKLKSLQTEFLRKLSSCKQPDYSAKFITIIQNKCCNLLVHSGDLQSLPRYLPVSSVNDLKHSCRSLLESGAALMYEQFAVIQSAQKESTTADFRDELRLKMETELNSKLETMIHKIDELCDFADKSDNGALLTQINDLNATKEEMGKTIYKLTTDLAVIGKSGDNFSKKLDLSNTLNHDLALKLSQKNLVCGEQKDRINELIAELAQAKATIKALQQQIIDNDDALVQLKSTVETKDFLLDEQLSQIEQTKADNDFLKQRFEKLTENQDERNVLIVKLQQQLHDLEERNATQQLQEKDVAQNNVNQEKFSTLRNEFENLNIQLKKQTKVEQELRAEIEEKQDQLRRAELKLCRMEEQDEHNRQMLNVRGDRIKHLDQEMKQRDLECKRKVNEILCTASAKSTAITQMSNQLAAKNEQFDHLCSNLSVKQTKLHSQEHVIKLLEESNFRSINLHTKLGERNTQLKEELDHLRRTVRIYVKILIGNNGQNVFEPVAASEVLRILTKSKE